MAADSSAGERAIRRLALPVYVPNLLFSTGQGAVIPILALASRQLGASPAMAGVVVAANGLGTLAFDLPAGWIVTRMGESRAGFAASALLVVGILGALKKPIGSLAGCVGLCGRLRLDPVGPGPADTHVARSRSAPAGSGAVGSGRSHALGRGGRSAGPRRAQPGDRGPHRIPYLSRLCRVGFVVLYVARDRSARPDAELVRRPRPTRVRDHSDGLATAGLAAFAISMLRASRQVMLPLWALHIGLSVGRVTLVFAVSAFVEFALFYPAGVISDRLGRWVVAVPCLALLSTGLLLLAASDSFVGVLAVGVVLGVGNGLGSGIVMTLGADRAPAVGRATFLSLWRLVSDAGAASGPLCCAALIAAASLSYASVAVGAVGLLSTVIVLALRQSLTQPQPSVGL